MRLPRWPYWSLVKWAQPWMDMGSGHDSLMFIPRRQKDPSPRNATGAISPTSLKLSRPNEECLAFSPSKRKFGISCKGRNRIPRRTLSGTRNADIQWRHSPFGRSSSNLPSNFRTIKGGLIMIGVMVFSMGIPRRKFPKSQSALALPERQSVCSAIPRAHLSSYSQFDHPSPWLDHSCRHVQMVSSPQI